MAVISLLSNLPALAAQRQLSRATDSLSRVTEKLSSGLRINRPSDDAAGQALATGLNVRSRVYSQGLRNANDAISALNIAQGSVEQLSSVMIRIKELATSAANSTYSRTQRLTMDSEANQLVLEFNRLTATTNFNGSSLISGNLGQIGMQLGFGVNERIGVEFGSGLAKKLGTGTFANPNTLSSGFNPTNGDVADVNGDGKQDVVNASGPTIYVSFGNGSGGFSSTVTFGTSGLAIAGKVYIADINGDGKADIIADTPSGAQVFTNQTGTTFSSGTTYGSSGGQGMVISDFNGDGRVDIVQNSGTGLRVHLGQSGGTFSSGTTISGVLTGTSLALGDFNGDGQLDVASKNGSGQVAVYSGNGAGSFAYLASSTISGGTGMLNSGDFNHDGITDLVSSGTNSIKVALGTSAGIFSTATSYFVGNNDVAFDFGVADINNDGYADIHIVGGNLSATNYVYQIINNGNGTFASANQVGSPIGGTGGLSLAGDMNNDGVLDLVSFDNVDGAIANIHLQNTTNSSNIARFDLTSKEAARYSLLVADTILDRITKELGNIGSAQSRLYSALNTLTAQGDNLSAAGSRIMDADLAYESSESVRLQILQQSAQGVLAQSKLTPQIALQLLIN